MVSTYVPSRAPRGGGCGWVESEHLSMDGADETFEWLHEKKEAGGRGAAQWGGLFLKTGALKSNEEIVLLD